MFRTRKEEKKHRHCNNGYGKEGGKKEGKKERKNFGRQSTRQNAHKVSNTHCS